MGTGSGFQKWHETCQSLDKSVEIHDKNRAACKTCACFQTCPSPKQSCWLPPHPHPRTSTIIFTAGNSKVVWSFRGWSWDHSLWHHIWHSKLHKVIQKEEVKLQWTTYKTDGRSIKGRRSVMWLSTQVVSLWLTVDDHLSRSQFVESIRSNQEDYTSFSKVHSNPVTDAF